MAGKLKPLLPIHGEGGHEVVVGYLSADRMTPPSSTLAARCHLPMNGEEK